MLTGLRNLYVLVHDDGPYIMAGLYKGIIVGECEVFGIFAFMLNSNGFIVYSSRFFILECFIGRLYFHVDFFAIGAVWVFIWMPFFSEFLVLLLNLFL